LKRYSSCLLTRLGQAAKSFRSKYGVARDLALQGRTGIRKKKLTCIWRKTGTGKGRGEGVLEHGQELTQDYSKRLGKKELF